jgi:hypothetical protein
MYIDTNNSHLTYNPSTETLTVENIIGNLFGIATNANFINVDTNSLNTNHQVLFSDNQGGGFQRPYIDTQSNQLIYNPSTNTFSVSNIVGDLVGDVTGNLTGVALNADFINIDEINSNTNYQLLFSTNQAAGYQRPYIDNDSNQLTYNPSTRTFSVQNINTTTITGSSFSGISNRADFINVDQVVGNTDYQVLFSDNQGDGYQRPKIDSQSGQFIYNPATNRLTAGSFTGDGAKITNIHGPNITTGVINVDRLPDASVTGQGVSKLNNSISGTSQTEAASSKAVGDLKSHANNASNLNNGIVNINLLPDASTGGQGVVQLSNAINGTSQTIAASEKAVGDLKLHANNASNLSNGTVAAARLPAATNSVQGAVIPINTYPPVSTSAVQPPSADAFRKLYITAGNLIPVGSNMIFYQANAPLGWTKLTTDNNKTIRVVNGSGGGSGGTNTFTSAFSQRGVPLEYHEHALTIGGNDGNHTHDGSTSNETQAHNHAGSTSNENAYHNHGINSGGAGGSFITSINFNNGDYDSDGKKDAFQTASTSKANVNYSQQNVKGNNANHSHTMSLGNESSQHQHVFTSQGQSANHKHFGSADGVGTTGAQMDFSVQYIDVIICKKD